MKNKKLISFCIHLLIGIIFSFPVITVEANAMLDQSCELRIIQDEEASVNLFLSDVTFQYNSKVSFAFSDKKVFSKNLTDGNSGSNASDYVPSQLSTFYHWKSDHLVRNLNSTFVNLSFLKDLKTTKMLC